jgi:hypothetical protein
MGHASGVPWNKFSSRPVADLRPMKPQRHCDPAKAGEAIQGNAQASLDCFVATSAPIPKFA